MWYARANTAGQPTTGGHAMKTILYVKTLSFSGSQSRATHAMCLCRAC
jgi:hypothetical protein